MSGKYGSRVLDAHEALQARFEQVACHCSDSHSTANEDPAREASIGLVKTYTNWVRPKNTIFCVSRLEATYQKYEALVVKETKQKCSAHASSYAPNQTSDSLIRARQLKSLPQLYW